MKTAVDFAGIVGKYISMERDADVTPFEVHRGRSPVDGMECVVVSVFDDRNGGVTIVADYGMSFTMTQQSIGACEWRFQIWPDEETRREHR